MGFVLRKTITAFIMPLPVALFVGITGWILWRRGKHVRLGRRMVAASLVGLAVLSIAPVAVTLVGAVEGTIPAFPGDSVAFVVVLGNGHTSDPDVPVTAQLTSQALYRLAEGLRIATAQPWTTLVLSGFGGVDPKSNAEVYSEVASSLGFPDERMILEPRPTSTAHEAELLQPVLQGHSFALVTSASHMHRALKLFEAQGLRPLPAPTGHLGKTPQGFDPLGLAPNSRHLSLTRTAWYEILGRLWASLRGAT